MPDYIFMRNSFFFAKSNLSCRRFSTDALVGFVFLRGFTGFKAFSKIAMALVIAMDLFSHWERSLSQLTCKTPSCVNRAANFWCSVAFSFSSNNPDAAMENTSTTFVSTLFTCCPPFPPLRAVRNVHSFSKAMGSMLCNLWYKMKIIVRYYANSRDVAGRQKID